MNFFEQVKGRLIVSCQALPEEPLHSSFIMSRMARAANESGAAGIRANSVVDIEAIQDEVDLPIIGIIKQEYPDSLLHITPTIKEVRRVAATGVAVVAMDGTKRPRPNGETLEEIIAQVREEFPDTLLMADIATVEEAQYAESLSFDMVGSTLHGYTEETQGWDISKDDFAYLKKIIDAVSVPVVAEGKIDRPEKAARVLELGAHTVVVGGAITRPQQLTASFVAAIEK